MYDIRTTINKKRCYKDVETKTRAITCFVISFSCQFMLSCSLLKFLENIILNSLSVYRFTFPQLFTEVYI